MRSVEVVRLTPAIEGPLGGGKVAEQIEIEDFGVQRAVEALDLAPALGVVGAAVQDFDAELQQPHAQSGPALAAGLAPWLSIVDEEGGGQAVVAEGLFQVRLDRPAPLIAAGLEARSEA